MEGIEGNMDVYPSKTERKNEEPLFFPPLVFSFVSLFLLHCAFSPFSPVVNVARNELDSPSARPSRLFFFFDKWRGINKRLPVRLAIFYDPLHTYVYICVDACLCIGLPASIRYTHTTYIYIYIFSFPFGPDAPLHVPAGHSPFPFFNFWREKKNNNITTESSRLKLVSNRQTTGNE